MAPQNEHSQSGFWFGMIMGGVLSGGALYLLGTKNGRDKLRSIMDTVENMDASTVEEITELLETTDSSGKKTIPDIHAVLDKIHSALPTKTEVQKFFAKDGKILK
ncbi:hypothetical protein KBC70_03980 [Candidatus Woesebacteria bacterium]|nr:hypothetical protein [Candidatus Woesebacteria bacterium]